MCTFALLNESGHLFVQVGGERWLIDTGAPGSFGRDGGFVFGGMRFDIATSQFGLDVAALSESVGVECAGLLGADVLGRFETRTPCPCTSAPCR